MRDSYYKSGDWNITCDWCGEKIKASRSRKTWDGYYVCPEHWEPRQPLDFLKGIKDDQTVPFSRPTGSVNPIPVKTSAYTILTTDSTIDADATTSPFTLSLPSSPVAFEAHYISKVDGTSNSVTTTGTGFSKVLSVPNTGFNVQYVNGQWVITSVYPSES